MLVLSLLLVLESFKLQLTVDFGFRSLDAASLAIDDTVDDAVGVVVIAVVVVLLVDAITALQSIEAFVL